MQVDASSLKAFETALQGVMVQLFQYQIDPEPSKAATVNICCFQPKN